MKNITGQPAPSLAAQLVTSGSQHHKPPPSTSPATTNATSSTDPSAVTQTQWNTKNLGLRLGGDALSAAAAGSLVAPVISVIDRSIMENASGRSTLSASILSSLRTLLVSPRSILLSRPSALIFLLYGGTYLTANAVDTYHSTTSSRAASHTTAGPSKFAASSAANVGLCIYKDQVFVKMFGPPGVTPRPVPVASYALFALRDCLTIFASFNVPPRLAPVLEKYLPTSTVTAVRTAGASIAASARKPILDPATAAQFIAPAAVQIFSTPLHLLGLDLYNRPSSGSPGSGAGHVSMRDRFQAVSKNWLVSSAARICRIVPAFGVGGVVNMKVRRNLMQKLE